MPRQILKNLVPFRKWEGLDYEMRLVDGIKQAFLFLSGSAGKKLKRKLVDQQEIVMNLADILAEAYVAESVVLKVQKMYIENKHDKKKLKVQKCIAQLYVYESLDRVRKSAKDAIASYTDGLEKRGLNRLLYTICPEYDVNPTKLRRKVADYFIKNGSFDF